MLGTSGHARRDRNFYPTLPEASAPIVDAIEALDLGNSLKLWECAAGDNAMVDVLRGAGHAVVASDIFPMADGIETFDFLSPEFPPFAQGCDGIVTNPPYGEFAQKFCERAVGHVADGNVRFAAMLMRHEYDCASTRAHLFDFCRFYAAKVTMTFRPKWIADSTGSPRHNYAWFIWRRSHGGRAEQLYAHRKD